MPAAIDHRSYVIVKDAQHGLKLMRGQHGAVRLRVDGAHHRAALIGEVGEIVETKSGTRVYHSIWTPVPFEIADEMSRQLFKMTEEGSWDSHGGRIGWKDAGYDGDIADWYCFVQ